MVVNLIQVEYQIIFNLPWECHRLVTFDARVNKLWLNAGDTVWPIRFQRPVSNFNKFFLVILSSNLKLRLFFEFADQYAIAHPGHFICTGHLEGHEFAICRNYGVRCLSIFKIIKKGKSFKVLSCSIEL